MEVPNNHFTFFYVRNIIKWRMFTYVMKGQKIMANNFYYSFPAIKGTQAGRDYFVIMCPLSIVSKLFLFNEEELPPEYRSQRILNRKRIPEMASYIVSNPHDYVFSSLTASIDGNFIFTPMNEQLDDKIGILQVSMDSRLLINDGQHRRAAIEEALKEQPKLADETISIVMFIDEGLKRSQQIFADLNKHAVNVSKSIGVLYDSRDPIATYTKQLLKNNQSLNKFTDKESTSIAKYSAKLFTLNSINETNRKLFKELNPEEQKTIEFADYFWNTICDNMIEWQQVFQKKLSASDLRLYYINSNAVVLEALGIIGNYLYQNEYTNVDVILSNLKNIDWHRENEEWKYRAIDSNGRIAKSSTYVKLTCNLIKQKLHLPLTKEEQSLENNLGKR